MSAQPTSLDDLASYINDYCAATLAPYLHSLNTGRIVLSGKEISDPIWNTIGLEAFEIGVLDSPLLQRLRQIRQLGVAHWLYPGAVHTRFEHSLGVVHAVHQLIGAVNKKQPAISPEYTHLLRLAALVHDVGHGIFSHVSEKALQKLPALGDIRSDFSEKYDLSDDKKMSEILTFLMLQSDSFKELLLKLQGICPDYTLPPGYQAKLSDLFLDRQIHDVIPLLQELISGPFDADKLDYLLRDAHMSGLPLVPDIPRLLTKVRALNVPRDKSPINLAEGVNSVTIIGIALSGARTLDELMLSRTWLFDKVYRHHKVRAVEGMITSAIERLYEAVEKKLFWKIVLDNDDRFLFIDDYKLAEGENNVENAQVIKCILQRIRSRELFCRCYSWSQVVSPQESFGATDSPFERLYRELTHNDSSKRSLLCKSIADESRSLVKLLQLKIDDQTLKDLEYLIVVDPPKIQKKTSETPRAFLITPDDSVIEFKKDSAESLALTNAYLVAGDLGYVFGPRELALVINLAVEKVLYENFGFRNTLSSLQYTKISQAQIDEVKEKLQKTEYYAAKFAVLRGRPPFLKGTVADKKLSWLETRFNSYQGIANDQRESGAYKVGKDAIVRWLLQFEDDRAMEIAFKVLESMRVVGRPEIISALTLHLQEEKFKGAKWLCPLGGPQDSSAVYSYLASDISAQFDIKTEALTHALMQDGPILFFDDFIGSGQQSIDILGAWLGFEKDPKSDLNEVRLPLPTDELRRRLLEREIGLFFYSGFKKGAERLTDWAKDKGIKASVFIGEDEQSLPSIDKAISGQDLATLKASCSDIGKRILDDGAAKHTLTWREERCLGYGNKGLLLAFPFNIPTQSLTCLWGEQKSIPWAPLFRRRKKV